MKNILFSILMMTATLFAEAELEIVESIPLDDMSGIQSEYITLEPSEKVSDTSHIDKKSQEWVNGLGAMHEKVESKRSYLKGILNGLEYGKYAPADLKTPASVKKLYAKRHYNTFWITSDFDISKNLFEMVDVIEKSGEEGLEQSKYHLSEIVGILDDLKNDVDLSHRDRNVAIAQVDVLLSDAFLTMAKDLREGELNYRKFNNILKVKSEKEEVNYNWENPSRGMDYIAFLEKVSASGNLERELLALATPNELYFQMKEAYKLYKNIALQGGWKKIPKGKQLRLGNISKKRVPLMAERLYLTGDLDYFDPDITVVTGEMKDALKHYQKRMAIWPSGVLTDITRNALNVSVEKRLKKIKLNLERMRWESKEFGPEYVYVNIPDFKMRFVKNGVDEIKMRVVVGKKKNPTPIFNSTFSYMVLNPTWAVPSSIVKKEMLPRIQEDPDYLATRKFKLYQWVNKGKKEIDGFDIDWWQYDENSHLPYTFVRQAGKGNPLGSVKFMFPNKYAVYMHDTPQKNLFKNSRRAYSHGCIRLHKPQELLEYMSNNYTSVPYSQVKKIQKSGQSQSVSLDHGIPVYIRYYTAWAEIDAGVSFRGDIYGYDKIQYKLLEN